MEGMGIVMLGMMFLCVVIVIILVSLVIGLLLSFCGIPLIYKLRGVPGDKRRIGWGLKIVLSIPLAILTGIIISVGTFLFMTYGSPFLSSPKQIYQGATDWTLQPSVTIIDSQNSSGDSVRLWLHFTTSPPDIAGILSSDNFIEQKNFSFDFSSFKSPAWWLPESLGTDVRYYECEENSGGEPLSRKCMYVNAETNEAFFLRFLY
ncbi:MAG: hypothetical protein FVQ82_14575 [Planctomycetes bacterium]|nr:hypothetical protein [Planctomycetota bacterium]